MLQKYNSKINKYSICYTNRINEKEEVGKIRIANFLRFLRFTHPIWPANSQFRQLYNQRFEQER